MNLRKLAQRGLNRLGYEIRRVPEPDESISGISDVPYVERDEYGPSNIQTKFENERNGIPFELPDIVNLNQATASLIRDETRIVELGAGTGTFANFVASDPRKTVYASEFDKETHDWAVANRSRANIVYIHGPVPRQMGRFDVAVAIELIEHVADYTAVIRELSRLAPRVLITTPNRARHPSHFTIGPPWYFKHVREWTAGEFYWVLRSFFHDVSLYGIFDSSSPTLIRVNVNSDAHTLIADCRSAVECKT